MWKFLSVCLIILGSLSLTSCEIDNNQNVLSGKHELRRFGTKVIDGSNFSGGYFLIGGSVSGESYSKTMATFTWKMNSGEYAISEIEVGKIRVRIDNEVTTPYVEFGDIIYSAEFHKSKSILQGIMDNVSHMTITCSEEDYPININFENI